MLHICKELKQHCKFVWHHCGVDYCHRVIRCPNCGEKVTPFLVCIFKSNPATEFLKCEYAKLKPGIAKNDPDPVKHPLPFLEHGLSK